MPSRTEEPVGASAAPPGATGAPPSLQANDTRPPFEASHDALVPDETAVPDDGRPTPPARSSRRVHRRARPSLLRCRRARRAPRSCCPQRPRRVHDDAPIVTGTGRTARRPAAARRPTHRSAAKRPRANGRRVARDTTTVVNVAIGRIEVRAATPAAPVKPRRDEPLRPRLSLEEYLAGASGEHR